MNKFANKERIKKIAETYAREMYLWGNPFEAPSVPPEDVIRKFMKNPEELDPDLVRQIETDINCGAAVKKLEICDADPALEENIQVSEEEVRKALESMKHPETKMDFPCKGGIFYTKSTLKVFDDKKGQNYNIYTFLPQAVLLLSDEKRKSCGTRLFRCAVVTPDFDGGAVDGQDMDLENGWILHKWLCFPVSFEQLDCERKMADVENIDKIAEDVNNYFFSEHEMTCYGRKEQRLAAMSDYVPVMADADMARAEWQAEHSASFDTIQGYTKESFRKSASTNDDVSRLVVRRGENAVAKSFEAELDVIIDINAGNCERIIEEKAFPTWTIDKDANIPDGTVFLLRDVRNGNTIGSGEILRGVAWLERLVPEAVAISVTDASQVVLEVYLPW
ncbi:hypothetical protein J6253_03165 [bacterium]|nr:hypothetical protein [bacterium]MBP5592231.1 hypothetical protein [bacterium]